jgi:hypothetical protein
MDRREEKYFSKKAKLVLSTGGEPVGEKNKALTRENRRNAHK